MDADKLSKRERSISQRESEISQKESDLDNRESLLSKREENVILITEGQQRITEEQQRKADEFQHREDALQAQAYNLTKRENMLTPAGQVVDVLGIVQTTSTNPKIQEAAKLVQKYVSKNKKRWIGSIQNIRKCNGNSSLVIHRLMFHNSQMAMIEIFDKINIIIPLKA